MVVNQVSRMWWLLFSVSVLMTLVQCNAAAGSGSGSGAPIAWQERNDEAIATHEAEDPETVSWEAVDAADLDPDERLRVVATTSIIGDVLSQVGGDEITLTVLISAGQDPHGYDPSARDLTAVSEAHVLFVNGWDLEAGLVNDLSNIADDVPILPLSAHIAPIAHNGTVDPHVWMNPHHVLQWVQNAELALSQLNPSRSAAYANNAERYRVELEALIDYIDEQVATIPEDRRKLVTNHDSLGYFAAHYGFEVIGTVIPATDTLAEPSANDLFQLVDQMREAGICTVYAETTASAQVARAISAELDTCRTVNVATLYTGAIGPAGSGAGSYIDMMRTNIDTIVAGQKNE